MQHLADTLFSALVNNHLKLQLGFLLCLCVTVTFARLHSCSWTRHMGKVWHDVKAVCDENIGYGSLSKVNVGQ